MKWVVAASVLVLGACAPAPPPLPVLGQIQPFQLIAQSAEPFDSKTLAGHAWVADFIFTNCPGPCPIMSKQMSQVQRETADLSSVKIVSFSVDPEHDTPPVLAGYAKHFVADPKRWFFLTGAQATLNDLGLHSFKLNPVDGAFIHSTRFVLVDKQMQIRGYYSTDEPGFMPKLVHDIRQVEAGTS